MSRARQSRNRLRVVWESSGGGLRLAGQPGRCLEHHLSGASVSVLPLVSDKLLGAPSTRQLGHG